MRSRASIGHARMMHASASTRASNKLVTAYSFAAKPPPESAAQQGKEEGKDAKEKAPAGNEESKEAPKRELRGRIDPASELGRWRSLVLQGGDAGEDALIVGRSADARTVVMCVADGVGGWVEQGVDPAHFSNALLFYVTKFINSQPNIPEPSAMLQDAFDHVLADESVWAGSSTACLVRLDASKGVLSSANLGDSGYVHLRPHGDEGRMEVVYLSPPQQYGFNTPYQLSKVPSEMQQEGSLSNEPKDAALREDALQPGDMVLVATDGFFDNVHCKLPPKEALAPDAPLRPELLQLIDMLQDKHNEHWRAANQPENTPEQKHDFIKVIASTYVPG